jgi:ribosomal protein S18 acetylase RimI-like enzyme
MDARRTPDDAALLRLADENAIEQFRMLARRSMGGMVLDRPGLTLVYVARALDALNLAILTDERDPEPLIATARAFFAERGARWSVRAVGPAARAFAGKPLGAGILPAASLPVMLLAPLAAPPLGRPEPEVRVVRTRAELALYRETMRLGFDMTAVLAEAIITEQLLDDPRVTCYLGFADGRPVATATRISAHGVAGIYSVSTIPAYRRRGIGAAMTRRAALDGRADGCLAAALQATVMGYPVYRRLGFRHVADHATWKVLA